MQADLQSGQNRGGGEGEGVEIKGAAHGDETEKEGDENFPESEVGQGKRAAGVGIGEEQGEEADEQNDPAAAENKRECEEGGQREGEKGAGHHPARGEESGRGDAGRAESPGGVGAFDVIDRVVEKVGRDLDEDGAGKDESGNQRIKRADRNGQSASGDHGNKRGTQGARAGGKDPRVHLQ